MMSVYVCLILVLFVLKGSASLECYSCNDIDSIDKCQRVTGCEQLSASGQSNVVVEVIDGTTKSETQSCFTRTKDVGGNTTYTMGCTVNENCGSIPVYAKMSAESPSEKCDECCGTDRCNKNLCKHPKPVPCNDAPTMDCAYWNKNFNICESIHQAKRICRKFCKLCDLVDGNWSEWSQWSGCDVTCGQGKHTRSRTCSNPAPAYQGLDCEGTRSDMKLCVRQLCPVHGGWTDWSSWGECPVSCGMGIQKRRRRCTNPYPSRYGDHCFGDSTDDKLCMKDSCHAIDGGWTDWGDWSNCSATCNAGMRKRSRSCSDPRPDQHGRPCDGDPMQVEICNNQPCLISAEPIAFNAYYVTDCSPRSGQTMIFSTVLTNQGAAYNKATGVFVAPRNGTYLFIAQLCIRFGYNMQFDIMRGNVAYATKYGYTYASGYECPSAQAVVELTQNDNVYVQWKQWSYSGTAVGQSNIYRNYFSGTFIHE